MARDYAKNRSNRKRSSKKTHSSSSASGWGWLLAGIIVGLFIAGLVYIKNHAPAALSKNTNVAEPVRSDNKHKASRSHAPTQKDKPSSQPPAPKFDFYTILPKAQINGTIDKAQGQQKSVAAESKLSESKLTSIAASNEETAAPQRPVKANEDMTAAKVSAHTGQAVATQSATLPAAENQLLADKVAKKPSTTVVANKQATPNAAPSYILKIASFKHSQQADQLKAQLVLLGFEVKIREVKVNNEILSQVWLGPYSTLQAANKEQRRLQVNNIKSTIVKL